MGERLLVQATGGRLLVSITIETDKVFYSGRTCMTVQAKDMVSYFTCLEYGFLMGTLP